MAWCLVADGGFGAHTDPAILDLHHWQSTLEGPACRAHVADVGTASSECQKAHEEGIDKACRGRAVRPNLQPKFHPTQDLSCITQLDSRCSTGLGCTHGAKRPQIQLQLASPCQAWQCAQLQACINPGDAEAGAAATVNAELGSCSHMLLLIGGPMAKHTTGQLCPHIAV